MLRFQGLWAIFFSLLVLRCLALADEAGLEYCQGDGSICEAFDGLDATCDKETGSKYYKCICETGWVPMDKACRYCLLSMGDLALVRDEYYSSICSADGYTVAPMPSSILSEQKARNKTVEVPAMTSTDSSTATATLDLSDNTMSHEALTTTMYGVASASLPQIAAPTETSGSIGWGVSEHIVGVVCAVVLAAVYNI